MFGCVHAIPTLVYRHHEKGTWSWYVLTAIAQCLVAPAPLNSAIIFCLHMLSAGVHEFFWSGDNVLVPNSTWHHTHPSSQTLCKFIVIITSYFNGNSRGNGQHGKSHTTASYQALALGTSYLMPLCDRLFWHQLWCHSTKSTPL